MSVIVASLQGRFGNQTLQYLFCRALAERYGLELRVEPWIGERVFDISNARPDGPSPCRYNETELLEHIATLSRFHPAGFGHFDNCTLEFRGYAQMQAAMIYTKRQAQAWLPLRRDIEDACIATVGPRAGLAPIVCHQRRDDYRGCGYVLVARSSYERARRYYGLTDAVVYLSDDWPSPRGELPQDLAFMVDFYRMMTAPTLLRANSSFSWLAALLGNGLVLSPVIDGLEGGREHDCNFVPGNWPRFANLDFVTDLHVAP